MSEFDTDTLKIIADEFLQDVITEKLERLRLEHKKIKVRFINGYRAAYSLILLIIIILISMVSLYAYNSFFVLLIIALGFYIFLMSKILYLEDQVIFIMKLHPDLTIDEIIEIKK